MKSDSDENMMDLNEQISHISLQTQNTRTTSHCKFQQGDVISHLGYKIIEQLGSRGRFATVWKATRGDSSTVALKVYRTGVANETYYKNEVKIYHRLLQCSGSDSYFKYNIMKYFGTFAHISFGKDLSPHIHPVIELELLHSHVGLLINDCVEKYNEGLSITVVKTIAKQIFTGLNYLHNCGIIHTDIKPDNLLLTKPLSEINTPDDIQIVIGDLGSSTVSDDIFSETVGSVHYLAPELVLDLKYTTAIDIWAAFVLCYELFTGDLLFDVYHECGINYSKNSSSDVEYSTDESETTDDQMSNSSGDEEADYNSLFASINGESSWSSAKRPNQIWTYIL